MTGRFTVLLASVMLALVSCRSGSFVSLRNRIDLGGEWQFAMDTSGEGVASGWYTKQLSDSVVLPGTMDENKKGIPNTSRNETMRLSRELMYAGKAWYRKVVDIPGGWEGRHISLIMERTKPSAVWVDSTMAGSNNNILSAQEYDLSSYLTTGKHTLTILIDNGKGSVPDGITGSHAWTEQTQGNWNGITGSFYLEASDPTYIGNVMVYPDIKSKKIKVSIKVFDSRGNNGKKEILLRAYSWNTKKAKTLPERSYPVSLSPGENIIDVTYRIGSRIQLWSEFDPVLYKLVVTLQDNGETDNKSVDFGMRSFATGGTQFTINGIKTFLRGKHDACVFPLTGHPPMDLDGWLRVFRIAKSYNINFYRFHSWSPPAAAFEAADIAGIYLQPELPFWGRMEKDNNELNTFLLKEGDHILKDYGNHASFVMFALGNELSGDLQVMKDFLKHFRSVDNRHLMAYGSNNYLGFRGQAEGEDYYAACRVGADTGNSYSTQIRGSFSFADAYEGGYVNGRYPSTSVNYAGAISKCTVPAIATEVGQYQIYPDYDQIKKYTGVMKPWNLEIFRERLNENNLGSQAKSFFRASGALSAICYKADIEMALRTPGFGGFHLLDLQDFPGQGTALVGLLDAFMDSKGIITPAEFGHFCNSVVPLFIMDKYCWTSNETFTGTIQVANYSDRSFHDQPVKWELMTSSGQVIGNGLIRKDINNGGLTNITTLKADLSKVSTPVKTTLTVSLDGTLYKNSWPVWIYPPDADTIIPDGITVSEKLDGKTLEALSEGAKVLLFPLAGDVKDNSVGGLYTPDYWNYSMFRSISLANHKPVSPGTMSILTDPMHPLFRTFPTEFYTNWQWWPIVRNSHPLILDGTPADYHPLVQVVDNIDRNHKLGLIFEFSVGKGKLLVCMSDLKAVQDKPEVRQLYSSILQYMTSDNFNPVTSLSSAELVALFQGKVTTRKIQGAKNISYD